MLKNYVFILFSTNLICKFDKKLFFKIGNTIFIFTINCQLINYIKLKIRNKIKVSFFLQSCDNLYSELFKNINVKLKMQCKTKFILLKLKMKHYKKVFILLVLETIINKK